MWLHYHPYGTFIDPTNLEHIVSPAEFIELSVACFSLDRRLPANDTGELRAVLDKRKELYEMYAKNPVFVAAEIADALVVASNNKANFSECRDIKDEQNADFFSGLMKIDEERLACLKARYPEEYARVHDLLRGNETVEIKAEIVNGPMRKGEFIIALYGGEFKVVKGYLIKVQMAPTVDEWVGIFKDTEYDASVWKATLLYCGRSLHSAKTRKDLLAELPFKFEKTYLTFGGWGKYSQPLHEEIKNLLDGPAGDHNFSAEYFDEGRLTTSLE